MLEASSELPPRATQTRALRPAHPRRKLPFSRAHARWLASTRAYQALTRALECVDDAEAKLHAFQVMADEAASEKLRARAQQLLEQAWRERKRQVRRLPRLLARLDAASLEAVVRHMAQRGGDLQIRPERCEPGYRIGIAVLHARASEEQREH